MKIGLLGGHGQLGCELQRKAKAAGHVVIAPTSTEVDLCDAAAVQQWVNRHAADAWINAAAYTAVDAAEHDAQRADEVNHLGARNLAEALIANQSAAPLVYLSTDYVFSGDKGAPYNEDDPTSPGNVYGSTKLAGEHASLRYSQAFVVRVSWVFGIDGHNFVKSIVRAARRFEREGDALRVVDDQWGAPCGTAAISTTLLRLLESSAAPGIYHFATAPHTNWHQFAQAIVAQALKAGVLNSPVDVLRQPSSALTQSAHRPKDGRLCADKLERALGAPPPPWIDDLTQVITHLSNLPPEDIDA